MDQRSTPTRSRFQEFEHRAEPEMSAGRIARLRDRMRALGLAAFMTFYLHTFGLRLIMAQPTKR